MSVENPSRRCRPDPAGPTRHFSSAFRGVGSRSQWGWPRARDGRRGFPGSASAQTPTPQPPGAILHLTFCHDDELRCESRSLEIEPSRLGALFGLVLTWTVDGPSSRNNQAIPGSPSLVMKHGTSLLEAFSLVRRPRVRHIDPGGPGALERRVDPHAPARDWSHDPGPDRSRIRTCTRAFPSDRPNNQSCLSGT